MDLPKIVNPLWRVAKSNTVLELQALFLLRDDTPNYYGGSPPVIIMFDDKFHRIPKFMWKQGEAVLYHLQTYRAPPNLGRATLPVHFEAILESDELLEEVKAKEEAKPAADDEEEVEEEVTEEEVAGEEEEETESENKEVGET